MAICLEQFVITVVGGIVDCELEISSSYDPPTLRAPSEVRTETVAFTYEIGAPARTKFVSEYIVTRTGGTGTPPNVTGRTFDPPAPEQGQAPNTPMNAQFRVTVPAYDNAQANQLGATGIDTHSIKLIIAEAADIVGN